MKHKTRNMACFVLSVCYLFSIAERTPIRGSNPQNATHKYFSVLTNTLPLRYTSNILNTVITVRSIEADFLLGF